MVMFLMILCSFTNYVSFVEVTINLLGGILHLTNTYNLFFMFYGSKFMTFMFLW